VSRSFFGACLGRGETKRRHSFSERSSRLLFIRSGIFRRALSPPDSAARRCARVSAPRPRGPPPRVACGPPSRPRRAEARREAAAPPDSFRDTPPSGGCARDASVVRSRGRERTTRRASLRAGPSSGRRRRPGCRLPEDPRARRVRTDASPPPRLPTAEARGRGTAWRSTRRKSRPAACV
jgi:hypothetical protein